MGREARIIGSAVDVYGATWDVRERRDTGRGWHVEIGWPYGEPRGRGGRGVAVVATQMLMEYISETRLKDVDLPIGSTAVKRLRAEHGIVWDWDLWWSDRSVDLMTMTLEAFCKKHGCSIGASSQRRSALKVMDV